MLAALQEKKTSLKPLIENDTRMKMPKKDTGAGILGEDLGEEEQQRIRAEFFAAGIDNWLPLLGDRSFPTVSIPLAHTMCTSLAHRAKDGNESSKYDSLEHTIDAELAQRGWQQAFVKLSTRSPKDAPQILAKAANDFKARDGLALPLNDRARLLAELVQQRFSISCGREAVELLTASDRVREDLEYALEAPCYDELNLCIVLRRWDGPIPIAQEFRGIVWNGALNAIGQYYHPLVFPELESSKVEIQADLCGVYEELRPGLSSAGFMHYIIDFAWLGPQNVKVIEINPFDGVALGCFPGSTGLFIWDDPEDRRIITTGPFEFRLRKTPLSDGDLKIKMNTSWRDIIAPPRQ